MNVTADYVDKVAKGIIPPTITTEYKGQYNAIKINLNNMVTMMSELLAETDKIIKGAADGQLEIRADAEQVRGRLEQAGDRGQRRRHQHRQSHERHRRLRGQGGQGHHPADHHHRVQGPVQRHQDQPEQHGQDDERAAGRNRQDHQGRGRRPAGDPGRRQQVRGRLEQAGERGQRRRHQHRQSHERHRRLRGQGGQGHHPADHHHRVQGPVQRHQDQPEQHGRDDERPARPKPTRSPRRLSPASSAPGPKPRSSWAGGSSWWTGSTRPWTRSSAR